MYHTVVFIQRVLTVKVLAALGAGHKVVLVDIHMHCSHVSSEVNLPVKLPAAELTFVLLDLFVNGSNVFVEMRFL